MAVNYTNTAEGGTLNSLVATGGAGSGQPWDIASSASITYTASVVMHGSQAYYVNTQNTASDSVVYWNLSGTTSAVFEGYFYFPDLTNLATRIIVLGSSGSGNSYYALGINGSSKLTISNASSTILFTSASAISASTWYRFEGSLDMTTAASNKFTLFTYLGDSSSSVAGLSSSTTIVGANPAGTIGKIWFGRNTGSKLDKFFMDTLRVADGTLTLFGPYSSITVNAGANTASIEPMSYVTLSGSATGASAYAWSFVSGSGGASVNYISGSTNLTASYLAPATFNGGSATFQLTANPGVSGSATASVVHGYLPQIEWLKNSSSAWVGIRYTDMSASTITTGMRPKGTASGPATDYAWQNAAGTISLGNGVYHSQGGFNSPSNFPYYAMWSNVALAIVGNGPDATWIEVPELSMSASNIAYYDAASAGTSYFTTMFRADRANMSNLTFHGTAQERPYNGVQNLYSSSLTYHDIVVKGIPGAGSNPPGEVFAWNEVGTIGTTMYNMTFDGTDDSGMRVGSNLLGLNNASGNFSLSNSLITGARWSHAVAFWHCIGNYTFTNVTFDKAQDFVNVENMGYGSASPYNNSITFASCTFGSPLASSSVASAVYPYASNQPGPSAVHMCILPTDGVVNITLTDCTWGDSPYAPWAGKFVVCVFSNYPYTADQSAASAINIIQSGSNVTASKLLIVNKRSLADGGTWP